LSIYKTNMFYIYSVLYAINFNANDGFGGIIGQILKFAEFKRFVTLTSLVFSVNLLTEKDVFKMQSWLDLYLVRGDRE
jgi:type IV secretory pathway TrbF-like protein